MERLLLSEWMANAIFDILVTELAMPANLRNGFLLLCCDAPGVKSALLIDTPLGQGAELQVLPGGRADTVRFAIDSAPLGPAATARCQRALRRLHALPDERLAEEPETAKVVITPGVRARLSALADPRAHESPPSG
jgi:hypothetical protein